MTSKVAVDHADAPRITFRISDVEAHQHGLRSPIAAIAGLADAALRRTDLDDDLTTQLEAIKHLAEDALRALERGEPG